MRDFIYVAHEAPVDDGFALDDLPGAGRLDLLCRCVNAALLTSHGVRDDTDAHLVLRSGGIDVTVRFEGSGVRGLNPDERSIAGLVRAALGERTYHDVEASPGVYVAERSLGEVVDSTDGEGVVLHEDGGYVGEARLPSDPTFVLSDHLGFTDDDLREVEGARRISLGPVALHADHATAVAHNRWDTEGHHHRKP